MSTLDRHALREKHFLADYRTGSDHPTCGYCNLGAWPCDAIQLLDELEELEAVIVALRSAAGALLDVPLVAGGSTPHDPDIEVCVHCDQPVTWVDHWDEDMEWSMDLVHVASGSIACRGGTLAERSLDEDAYDDASFPHGGLS